MPNPLEPLVIDFVKANLLHEVSRLKKDLTNDNKEKNPTYYHDTEEKIEALEIAQKSMEKDTSTLVDLLQHNDKTSPSILDAAKIRRRKNIFSYAASKVTGQTETIKNIMDPEKLIAIKIFQDKGKSLDSIKSMSDLQKIKSETWDSFIKNNDKGINWDTSRLPTDDGQLDKFKYSIQQNINFLETMQQIQQHEEQAQNINTSFDGIKNITKHYMDINQSMVDIKTQIIEIELEDN